MGVCLVWRVIVESTEGSGEKYFFGTFSI
jgi:hypothetical protein